MRNLLIAMVLLVSQSAMSFDTIQWHNDSFEQEQTMAADAGDVLGGLVFLYMLDQWLDDDKSHVSNRRRVRIPLRGRQFRGENTIYLRRELKDMGVRLKNRRLKKVILIAKSRRGMGKATLQLGNRLKPTQQVKSSRHGYGFHSNTRESYRTITWNANKLSNKLWQIHLRGNIKVKSVVMVLD